MSAIPPEDILKYTNAARTNPSAFAKYVKDELDSFINESQLPLKPHCNYSTNEGKKAWKEAYEYLTSHKPMDPFILNEGLTLAADDHVIDMAKNNFFGHNSSNGQTFSKRIEKRCGKAYGSSGQNIGADFKVPGRDHALQTVLGLIIDDGVSSRGHRSNIFSTDFKYIGCSSRVQGDKINTVMDFHSQNLPTINGNVKPSSTSQKVQYDPKDLPKKEEKTSNQGGSSLQGGGGGKVGAKLEGNYAGKLGDKLGTFKASLKDNLDKDHFGGKGRELSQGGSKGQSSGVGGNRCIVSKSTNTKSKPTNGVIVIEKITKKTTSKNY